KLEASPPFVAHATSACIGRKSASANASSRTAWMRSSPSARTSAWAIAIPHTIYCCGLIDHALTHQHGEAPGLAAEFGDLGVGDCAPCFEERVLGGHAIALDLAHAMFRDLIQRNSASLGAMGGRSFQAHGGKVPNFSRYLCALQPAL